MAIDYVCLYSLCIYGILGSEKPRPTSIEHWWDKKGNGVHWILDIHMVKFGFQTNTLNSNRFSINSDLSNPDLISIQSTTNMRSLKII